MEPEQRISYLRSLLGSPVWTDIIKPEKEKEFLSLMKQAAVGRNTLSEAQLRCLLAEAAEIERFLTRYQHEIEEFDLTKQEEQSETDRQEQENQDAEWLADVGFRSPYVGRPPIGAEDADEHD